MSSKKAAKARRREEAAIAAAEAPQPISARIAVPSDEMLASLLAAAQAHVDTLDMEAAIAVYLQILASSPQCLAAVDGLADAYMQVGDREQAMRALKRSIELQPDGGSDRFMNLGQLSEGADALAWLERGVAMLRKQREACSPSSSDSEPSDAWLRATHELATALCSIAEVFLTDACDEPEAEERCDAAASEAVELVRPLTHQALLEPYVTLASVRLSQQRPVESRPLLLAALDIIANSDEDALPPFDVRLSCAKLLMEVGEALGDGDGDGTCRGAAGSSGSSGGSGRSSGGGGGGGAQDGAQDGSDDANEGEGGEGAISLAGEALELMLSLRLERDEALEVWYLTCVAALQAGEPAQALAEANAACAFAQSDACPPDEREWIPQLLELCEEARAACEAEPCEED